ncbi:MAG: glycosyltransferase family 4 protein [Bdellovibrionales bacterium]|nr:glycosyltransferase family 4 protein [Bdellovibrionales bacterium]
MSEETNQFNNRIASFYQGPSQGECEAPCVDVTARFIRQTISSNVMEKSSNGNKLSSPETPSLSKIHNTGRPVRIGIDARIFLVESSMERGLGHYTFHHLLTLSELCPDWQFLLFVDFLADSKEFKQLLKQPNIEVAFFENIDKYHLSIFHIPDCMSMIGGYDCPFKLAPTATPVSILAHDLIPLRMSEGCYDQWATITQQGYMRRLRLMKEREDVVVLANSEYTRNDLMQIGKIDSSRISVVWAGLNQLPNEHHSSPEVIRATLEKYKIKLPFILHVGGLDPHKNFFNTFSAYMSLQSKVPSALVVVGSDVDPYKTHFKDIVQFNKAENVVFTGFVARSELNALYASAAGLAFPSQLEGFGFPALEAVAHGCPVIGTRTGALAEIIGDAGFLVDPLNYKQIASAMESLLTQPDLRAELSKKGYERAKSFSWQRTAQLTKDAWQELWEKKAVAQPDYRCVAT